MDQSKDVSDVPHTPPLNVSNNSIAAANDNTNQQPPNNKSNLKQILTIIGIALLVAIVIVALIMSLIAYGIHSVISECDKKATTIIETDKRLKSELSAIEIGDQTAHIDSDNNINTDCLTGSENDPVTASYNYAAPNVAVANDAVKKALQSTTTPTFNPIASGATLRLETTLKGESDKNYLVEYRFAKPIDCAANGQPTSCDLKNAITQYDLLNQPINAVTLTVWGSGNTY